MSNNLQETMKNRKTKAENQEELSPSCAWDNSTMSTTRRSGRGVLPSCTWDNKPDSERRTTGTRRSGETSKLPQIIDFIDDPMELERIYDEITGLLISHNNNIDTIRSNIAYNIKELREFRRITQEELAYDIGVERQYIGQIESEKRTPSLEVICKLAANLGVSIVFFIATKWSLDMFDIAFNKIQAYQKSPNEDKNEFSEE